MSYPFAFPKPLFNPYSKENISQFFSDFLNWTPSFTGTFIITNKCILHLNISSLLLNCVFRLFSWFSMLKIYWEQKCPFLSNSISAHKSISTHRELLFSVLFMLATNCTPPTPTLSLSPVHFAGFFCLFLKWVFLHRIRKLSWLAQEFFHFMVLDQRDLFFTLLA